MTNAPECKLPNGTTIKPTQQGQLNGYNELSKEAKFSYVHPLLKILH